MIESDMDVLFRIAMLAVAAWPALVSVLVYLMMRSRVTRTTSYFVASIMTGYALSLLIPVVIVFGGFLLGAVAEVAVVYAIFLSTPVIVVLTTVSAVYWSGRYGSIESDRGETDAG